jgi:RHS repeat-associated protein
MTSAPAMKFNLRYPGQYFDEESGLHYNYFRSYSPTSGRYTQADPIGLSGGWNRFGYVEANPLAYTDPRGQSTVAIPVGIGAGLGALCWADPNCRQKMQNIGQQCIDSARRLKDWMFSSDSNAAQPPLPNSNPIQGDPGCEVECFNRKGNKKQTRRYGPDGYPETDTDWDHSHDGLGLPHSHDWTRPTDGSAPTHNDRGPGRAPVPGDPGLPK